jgi:phage tail sheath protein FI
MPFQVSPGVNVSEIDLTTVVPAVSSTEGAFAGQFRWGPVEQRVLLDSEDRLVTYFGKPTSNTAEDFFTAANFLSYGNALYVVRVAPSGALNASTSSAALIKNEDAFNNGSFSDTFYSRYAGDLGNSLKVSVCFNTAKWQSNTDLGYIATRNSNTVWAASANTAAVQAAVSVGDILVLGSAGEQRKVLAVGGTANGTHVAIGLADAYSGSSYTGVASSATALTRRWEYYSNFDRAPVTGQMHIAVVDEDGSITGTTDAILEKYEAISGTATAKKEDGTSNYVKTVINQGSQYIYCGTAPVASASSSLTGGTDGSADLDPADKIVGYDLFKSAEDIDISFVLGGNADGTLATYLIDSIAGSRKDCVAVISPEKSDVVNNAGGERDDIIAFRNTLPSSSYAVMDSGWKYQYDKYNDVYRWIPTNADTAGLMVQTDTTRDPWFSPAGFNRGNLKNVIKLAYNPSKGDRDQLYKAGVNPIVTFPGQGTVLFGDKTMLTTPSAFDRINVRRLFIVLEKAISTASQFTLFEFNDDFTRAQFRNLVEPFLRDVQGRRGITDFRVVCDGTNNTGEVIDRNEFIGDIYIKPARSINFIQLNFVAVRSGVEFSEIVGQF